ncbi:hypothetical protein K2173_015136 [Erythroxylum novogranatense]|uniref:Protein BIG GRAIN 1-like E n=1 Tax=Erythroxylum novogranatense TaxID=1862640 RepID=A0AAV8T2X4_9ROSI|nr:hypothetical protein K2173_015136 [Erythroxylum novogranatense]
MSVTGLADAAKPHKKSFHRRNDSDEIDVFEAARYFSGYNEAGGHNGATYGQKYVREDHKHTWRVGRMSLDVPMRTLLPHQESHHSVDKQIFKEKKHKQPSSPGGRLASFLNSLFSQTSLKKKKSKSSTQSMKDDDGSPSGRRKRRSSISHFRSSSSTDTKSLYSSSSSGFRTPPPYAQTPTKGYKEFRSFSDNKQLASLSKQNGSNVRSISLQNEVLFNHKRSIDVSWLEEKFKHNDGLLDKHKNVDNKYLEKDRNWVDQYPSEEKEFRKFNEIEDGVNEIDDGADSDSSSDLFELQNYDLGIYSSGLPVYETTNMDSIKRGTPISNGTI